MGSVTLRYFDCRGRAQPIRFFLGEMGISFKDERVPFTDGWQAWAEIRADPRMSGPFGKLPVLVWDQELLVETALISSFLQMQRAPSANLTPIAEAQSAVLDDLFKLYELLNLDILAPGADVTVVAKRVHSSLVDSFQRYEALDARTGSPFRLPSSRSIAGFWLLEVWQLSQVLLGSKAISLVAGLSSLQALLQELSSLPVVKDAGEAVPQFWSARPDESERLALLRAALAL